MQKEVCAYIRVYALVQSASFWAWSHVISWYSSLPTFCSSDLDAFSVWFCLLCCVGSASVVVKTSTNQPNPACWIRHPALKSQKHHIYIYIQILRPKPNSAHPWTDPTPHNCARNILKTRLTVWASQCAWPAPHRPALGRRLRAQDGKSNRAAASSANQTVFKSFSRLWKYFLTAKIRYKWNSATKNSSARKFVDAEALKEIIKHVTKILTCEENFWL